MRRTPLRAAAVTIGGLALAVGPVVAPASAASHEIQLLGINDFHGRLEASVQDNDTPDDESDDFELGGAKLMAGAVAELTSTFGGDTYFLSGGDNIGASTFTSNVQEDEPTIAALNAMGLDASTVGNHEFDKGFDDIAPGGRVDALADFPYLGANVYADGAPGVALLQEYEIVTTDPDGDPNTDDGVTIGFIGTVTDETASLVTPSGIEGITFGDEAEAANRVADQLTDADPANGDADIVVLLTHAGSSSDVCADVAANEVVANAQENIDAIIQGHTHTAYACAAVVGVPGGFTGPVVQSGQYGEGLDRITLTYDDVLDEVIAATAEVLPIVSTEYAATNTEVNQIVDAAVAFAAEAGAVPLGTITTDILRACARAADGSCQINPTTGRFVDSRAIESALGNFIADVQLAQTAGAAGAQIAFMNPGGLRDDFLIDGQFGDEACGVVTLGEANAVQPFANAVVTKTYSGAEIWATLEQQWQPVDADRPFLALGVSEGFFFEYDSDAAAGEHITAVTLNGEPIPNDASQTYRVTVNEFLASGGDNFGALGGGTDAQQLGQSDLEALTAYLDANSPATPDEESRRLVDGEPVVLNATGATCPAAAAPPADDGQNDGLSVDTGVTGTSNQGWVAGGLLLVLAAGGAVALRRREKAVR